MDRVVQKSANKSGFKNGWRQQIWSMWTNLGITWRATYISQSTWTRQKADYNPSDCHSCGELLLGDEDLLLR